MDFMFTVYDPKSSEQTPKCVLKKYATGALIEKKGMCPECYIERLMKELTDKLEEK